MNANMNHLESVLRQWIPLGGWTISSGPSGMNNTTHYLEVYGASYVLRIYETHRDEAKVRYEHAVLLGLAQLALPFSTPMPVITPSGESYLRLEVEEGREAGKLAALFHFIAGERPELREVEQIHSFGRAAAQLAEALQRIELPLAPVYPAYYQLGLADSQSTLQEVIRFCQEPSEPFLQWRAELHRLGELLQAFASETPALQGLPHQLIHGDLNASNSLVGVDGEVAALLDFEFTTMDLRVMEVAVCLSELIVVEAISIKIMWNQIEAFISGYGSAVKLSLEEVSALPHLILLRRLDVFVHFLSRYKEGIDPAEIVVDMIRSAISVDRWLQDHEESLVALSERHLLAHQNLIPEN
jgi:homoserine kinase type II